MKIKLTSDDRTIDATIVNFDDMFNADVDTICSTPTLTP
jgi:hypothetical protein